MQTRDRPANISMGVGFDVELQLDENVAHVIRMVQERTLDLVEKALPGGGARERKVAGTMREDGADHAQRIGRGANAATLFARMAISKAAFATTSSQDGGGDA